VLAAGQFTPGFLKLCFCAAISMFVSCMYASKATNNCSCGLNNWSNKLILLSTFYIQLLPSIFFKGMALVAKSTLNSCQRWLRLSCISCLFKPFCLLYIINKAEHFKCKSWCILQVANNNMLCQLQPQKLR